jgi:hypothetical protein
METSAGKSTELALYLSDSFELGNDCRNGQTESSGSVGCKLILGKKHLPTVSDLVNATASCDGTIEVVEVSHLLFRTSLAMGVLESSRIIAGGIALATAEYDGGRNLASSASYRLSRR